MFVLGIEAPRWRRHPNPTYGSFNARWSPRWRSLRGYRPPDLWAPQGHAGVRLLTPAGLLVASSLRMEEAHGLVEALALLKGGDDGSVAARLRLDSVGGPLAAVAAQPSVPVQHAVVLRRPTLGGVTRCASELRVRRTARHQMRELPRPPHFPRRTTSVAAARSHAAMTCRVA